MRRMTIFQALTVVIASSLLFCVIGSGLGWTLGTFVPGYYRSVFRGGNHPDFDPIAVGVGQGSSQGAAAGAAIGLGLVAIFMWRELKGV